MRLDGKVAVITGGGSGIGSATAALFADEGARVVVTGRRADPLREVADRIGGTAIVGDEGDPGHPASVVSHTIDAFGGVDIVIANAGTGDGRSALDVDDAGWQRALDVNLTGPLRMARAAIPSMIDRGGGSIVFVSSVIALAVSSDSAAYAASKTALLGLSRSIAVDFGPAGIRANVICPGWVRTPMGDRAMDGLAADRALDRDDGYRIATSHVPLRRPAMPEEIAKCCLFFASDESSIVTGAVLVADGGQTAVDLGGLAFEARDR